MWNSREESTRLKTVYCPVCNVILGKRSDDSSFIAHCEECRATFIWRTKDPKPSVQLDKNKPIGCGCNGCGR